MATDQGDDRRCEYAWAAGYYEGDGSITFRPPGKGGISCTLQLSITSVDREPLDHFLAVVGFGGIFGPYTRRNVSSGRKPQFMWRGHRVANGEALLANLGPWLSVRRRSQIEDVLTAIAEWPNNAQKEAA